MSMPDGEPAQAPTRRWWQRWTGWLLVGSLALNLLVLAAVSTAAWRHGRDHFTRGNTSVFAYTHTLPEARRQQLLAGAEAERSALRPYRMELRRARAAVREALLARPFDAERYRRAHDALLKAEIGAREAAHKLFEAIVVKLSDDERARLSQWLTRAERPWRRRGRASGDDDERAPPPAPPGR
jgi:uncharacterized membrane protein